MKKIMFFSVLLLFAGLSLMAQTKEESFLDIDYKAMENFAKNHTSEFNALINRFNSGDTTLTDMEVAKIYYGSYFSSDYSYEEASEKLRELMSSKSYKAAFELCKKELEKSPCSLDLLFKAKYCYYNLGENNGLYLNQIRMILGVILSSGDGRTEETAFKVLAVSDEYCILYSVFGVYIKKQALIGHCDRMTVYEEKDPDTLYEIYFDVSLHLSKLSKMFEGLE